MLKKNGAKTSRLDHVFPLDSPLWLFRYLLFTRRVLRGIHFSSNSRICSSTYTEVRHRRFHELSHMQTRYLHHYNDCEQLMIACYDIQEQYLEGNLRYVSIIRNRWQIPPLAEVTETRDDICFLIQSLINPPGYLCYGISHIRMEFNQGCRLTTRRAGYFTQKFFKPSGEEICPRSHWVRI